MTTVPFVLVGKHPPTKATIGSSGYDLAADVLKPQVIKPGQRAMISCGIKLALPRGWEAQVRPRSGLAKKHGITVLNTPGTIDSDYRGVVRVILINHGQKKFVVEPGDRIAQIVFKYSPMVLLTMAGDLNETERGSGGFGSTGVGQES